MTYTRYQVLELVEKVLLHKRPLTSGTFRDLEFMAEGDRCDDGMGGYLRDTYYPGLPDSFFQEVISEVRMRMELRQAQQRQ